MAVLYCLYRQRLYWGENEQLYMDWRRPMYHRRTQAIPAIWIYASRRITVSIDNEERDRKDSNRKGLLDHWHVCTVRQCFSHFDEKQAVERKRNWLFPRFTRWNKVGVGFFYSQFIQASRRLFHRGCQNWTMYATRPWALTLGNWQIYRHVVSFRIIDVTCFALLLKQQNFQISKLNNIHTWSYFGAYIDHSCMWNKSRTNGL